MVFGTIDGMDGTRITNITQNTKLLGALRIMTPSYKQSD